MVARPIPYAYLLAHLRVVCYLLCCSCCIQTIAKVITRTHFFIKVSDDTVVISLLFGDQNGHVPVVSDFVNWCDESYLCLNVSKTKDLSVDFRTKSTQPQPTVIHDKTVESVDHDKYF